MTLLGKSAEAHENEADKACRCARNVGKCVDRAHRWRLRGGKGEAQNYLRWRAERRRGAHRPVMSDAIYTKSNQMSSKKGGVGGSNLQVPHEMTVLMLCLEAT
jgi:hypothetical protein